MNFFKRWKYYSTLNMLSRYLGSSSLPNTTDELLKWSEEKEGIKNKLFSIIIGNKDCIKVLKEYNTDSKILNSIYKELLEAGAGQWVKGKYIPCWALAEPKTLDFLVKIYLQNSKFNTEQIFSLIQHYETGDLL